MFNNKHNKMLPIRLLKKNMFNLINNNKLIKVYKKEDFHMHKLLWKLKINLKYLSIKAIKI